GLFAADPAVVPVISTPSAPLHLHGYQPATMLGGHVGSATAVRVTATVWPLAALSERPVHGLAPGLFEGVLPRTRRLACACPVCMGVPLASRSSGTFAGQPAARGQV